VATIHPFPALVARASQNPVEAPPVVVALAAHDAATPIGPALLALAAQAGPAGLPVAPGAFGVALALGPGCARLGAVARALAPELPFPLLIRDAPPPPGGPAAFWSRRRALDLAASWLEDSGYDEAVMLLTDAAALPSTVWLWDMLTGLDHRVEAVTGSIIGAPEPDARAARLGRLSALLDPGGAAPPAEARCDANLALRLSTWRRLPALPPAGGQAALLAALGRAEVRLRHLPGALLALPVEPEPAPPQEAFGAAWRRLRLTAALRRLWVDGVGAVAPETPALRRVARRLGLPPGELARRLSAPRFGDVLAGLGLG
jgi:hypothetical protein